MFCASSFVIRSFKAAMREVLKGGFREVTFEFVSFTFIIAENFRDSGLIGSDAMFDACINKGITNGRIMLND